MYVKKKYHLIIYFYEFQSHFTIGFIAFRDYPEASW